MSSSAVTTAGGPAAATAAATAVDGPAVDELNGTALVAACRIGDMAAARAALKAGAESHYQEVATGTSGLMAAAGANQAELVELMLQRGAPWNAVDRKGKCAGQYALAAGHQALVDRLVVRFYVKVAISFSSFLYQQLCRCVCGGDGVSARSRAVILHVCLCEG